MKAGAAERARLDREIESLVAQLVAMGARKDTCCFLAQQVAEKALKAFLFFHREELIFTHSVFRLCQMVAQYDTVWEALCEPIQQFDFYYVEARYLKRAGGCNSVEFITENDPAGAVVPVNLARSRFLKAFLPAVSLMAAEVQN